MFTTDSALPQHSLSIIVATMYIYIHDYYRCAGAYVTIAGSPGAWHPRSSHTSQWDGALWSRCCMTRSEAEQQVHRSLEQPGSGTRRRRLRLGGYRTPLMTTTPCPGIRQLAVVMQLGGYRYAHAAPGKLSVGWAARFRWTAEAIKMGNYHQCQTNFSGIYCRVETERRSKEWPTIRFLVCRAVPYRLLPDVQRRSVLVDPACITICDYVLHCAGIHIRYTRVIVGSQAHSLSPKLKPSSIVREAGFPIQASQNSWEATASETYASSLQSAAGALHRAIQWHT